VSANAPRHSVAVLLSGREQFSPYFGGAVARWTYEVYSLLREQLEITVFGFPTPRKDLYLLPHESSRLWQVCAVLSKIPRARRYEETLWLRALIGRLANFRIVHIQNRPQWVATLRTLGYRGAIVLHLHNDHLGHWASPQLDELAGKLDAVAVCSDYLRRTFASRSLALDAKTRVVFNAANLKIFFPREEIRQPKTIFFVGRFDAEKGVLQLLKAYELVLRTHPDAKLVIAGATKFGAHRETAYVQQVKELARRLIQSQGAHILFTEYLDHDKELPVWFQKATIFVCPSLFQEPFGLVNAEAMACATAVVASRRGGIPEVIGDAGRLVDPENVEEFAAAISELLANPPERKRLALAGYERCRQLFDWHVTAENWMALIDRVVEREPPAIPRD
jgi:glycosyltransferase involved in cell wall biosynthesis